MLPGCRLLLPAARLRLLRDINNSRSEPGMNYSHADVRRTVNALRAGHMGTRLNGSRCCAEATWCRSGHPPSGLRHFFACFFSVVFFFLFSSHFPATPLSFSPRVHPAFPFHSSLSPRLHACRARRLCLKETTQGQG